jgi:hypothetical protein
MSREKIRAHPKYETCSQCKGAFENIALHWQNHHFCEYPNYTPEQKAVTTGLLLYRGYLNRPGENSNASLACFFEDESLASELFDFYNSLSLKVSYMSGEQFFGQHIRRSYVFVLRAHPYLTDKIELWGTGSSKSHPSASQIEDVSETTYALLYRLIGNRGYDTSDWAVFDCSKSDVRSYLLRDLLEEYDSFVETNSYTEVVLKNTDKFFADIEGNPIGAV